MNKPARTLTQAIADECKGLYRIKRLGPTSLVRGQAFTYLQKSLRLDGWRGVTYSNITKLIESSVVLGWDRGRGRRIAHGGNRMWGNDCDVVYVVASLSQCTDEQMRREEKDEWAAGHF